LLFFAERRDRDRVGKVSLPGHEAVAGDLFLRCGEDVVDRAGDSGQLGGRTWREKMRGV
jgi:hypothetical protein